MFRIEPASRRLAVPGWAVLVVFVWIGAVGVHGWLSRGAAESGAAGALCQLRRLTGVPCPTCGTTRAVLAAGEGRFVDAFRFNPFMGIAVLAIAAWLALRVGFARKIVMTRCARAVFWSVVAVAFLANWGYVIRTEFG